MTTNESPSNRGETIGEDLRDIDPVLIERIFTRINKTDDCWLWTGSTNPYGYGYYSTPVLTGACRTPAAHRMVYQILVGPIPDGLELDHLCRVRLCVNPKHLEPVTHMENIRRSPLVVKDACSAGHPYTEGSFYFDRGARACKECKKASVAAYAKRADRAAVEFICDHCGLVGRMWNRANHIKTAHPEHYQPRRGLGRTKERHERILSNQRKRRSEKKRQSRIRVYPMTDATTPDADPCDPKEE